MLQGVSLSAGGKLVLPGGLCGRETACGGPGTFDRAGTQTYPQAVRRVCRWRGKGRGPCSAVRSFAAASHVGGSRPESDAAGGHSTKHLWCPRAGAARTACSDLLFLQIKHISNFSRNLGNSPLKRRQEAVIIEVKKGGDIMTQQDLDAIRGILQQELKPVNERLDNMQGQINGMQDQINGMQDQINGMQGQINGIKDQLDEVQEDTRITRGAVNSLCEWAEHVAVVTAVTFPIRKAE